MNFESFQPATSDTYINAKSPESRVADRREPEGEEIKRDILDMLDREVEFYKTRIQEADEDYRGYYRANIPLPDHSPLGYSFQEQIEVIGGLKDAAERGDYAPVMSFIEGKLGAGNSDDEHPDKALSLLRAVEYRLCRQLRPITDQEIISPKLMEEFFEIELERERRNNVREADTGLAYHVVEAAKDDYASGKTERARNLLEGDLFEMTEANRHLRGLLGDDGKPTNPQRYEREKASIESSLCGGRDMQDYRELLRILWAGIYEHDISKG